MKKILLAVVAVILLTGCSSAPSTKTYTSDRGLFEVKYDANKRQIDNDPSNTDSEVSFEHRKKDGYAMIIAERMGIPLENLKKIALDNAKNAAPDAKIVKEEMKKVNGKDILFMQLQGTIDEIPFVYYSYYYTDSKLSLQFITYTSQDLLDEYKDDFQELLDGLVITTSGGVIPTNNNSKNSGPVIYTGEKNAFRVEYDTNTWNIDSKSENSDAEVSFEHKKGDGYGMIIAEHINIPLATLKKGALENAKEVAPDAKITKEETKTINGKEITFLQIEGAVEGVTVVYHNYYYAGPKLTLQFITYTSKELFKEYESDFDKLLNGLTILN